MAAFVPLILQLIPWTACDIPIAKCILSDPLPIKHKYYQPEDLIVAGISSQSYMFSNPLTFERHPFYELLDELIFVTQTYQHILAFVFAVKEINKNTQLSGNVSLGFSIYNDQFTGSITYLASLKLLSTWGKFIPNYKCDTQGQTVAVIGGPNSKACLFMASILSLYKIPQLCYGSSPVINDQSQQAFFQWMFPDRSQQYMGLLQLLLLFRWIWIGVIFIQDDNGLRFVQHVLPTFSQKGICFDFVEALPTAYFQTGLHEMIDTWIKTYRMISDSTATVVVLHGEIHTMIFLRIFPRISDIEDIPMKTDGKVWIMTGQMEFTSVPFQRSWDIDIIHGALIFATHSKDVVGFQKFLQMRNPSVEPRDGFIKDFWKQAFDCSFPTSLENKDVWNSCTGEEKLQDLPGSVFDMSITPHSYSVYNAVYAVAHALQSMSSSQFTDRMMTEKGGKKLLNQYLWQFHHYLRKVSFNNSVGETISFGQSGMLEAGFDIINWVTFPNLTFLRVRVGQVDLGAPDVNFFIIEPNAIVWPRRFNQGQPLSLCNELCRQGYSKTKKEGKPFCCYDCFPCPAGKVSNQTDMDFCYQCPEEFYPSEAHDCCIPKGVNFLSFEEPLGIAVVTFALFFSSITALVLGIFVNHKDTPIVKANNRDLSYALLIALLLSFLCIFLFVGQPKKVTCLLRHTAFGIIFSVAISCVLAKTITVVLAFLATKPGSKLRKWTGKKLAVAIVLSCPLIQTSVCATWLANSAPFPDMDLHFTEKEMVLECSQGSSLMFYCVLGFIGLLAMISFTVAFLGRNLPDSFNETKFIALSTLLFCSVWISFVPAYQSIKGKYMVAVEIFSILCSSAGLLVFIFSPKVYIILVRPELNNRQQLLRRNPIN